MTAKIKYALIVFPDVWLSHSPSILNLKTILEKNNYLTDIVTFYDKNFERQISSNIHYLTINPLLKVVLSKLFIIRFVKIIALYKKIYSLKNNINFDLVIGVDSTGFIASRLHFDEPIFFSLEIKKDIFFKISKLLRIKWFIIQSEQRRDYLFNFKEVDTLNVFYIQNSPILNNKKNIINKINKKRRLIYLGTIVKNHGIELCIDALDLLDHDISLTLKGSIEQRYKNELLLKYNKLIMSNRLIIDDIYIKQELILDYLTQFSVGFCFYDKSNLNDFNYVSCPSGKVFNYLAANVPVVGIDIIGLEVVKKYQSGILLENPDALTVSEAITTILDSVNLYSSRCASAIEKYNFEEMASKFIREYTESKPALF